MEENKSNKCLKCEKKVNCQNVSGGMYGLGFLGAAFYFIGHAATFWMGVLGLLKAFIWPAIIVYKLLAFLTF